MIHDTIGRAAVRLAGAYLRRRYRREIRIAAGLGAVTLVVGAAAYLAGRGVPEG